MRVAELVGEAPAGAKLVLVRHSAAQPLDLKCFLLGGHRGALSTDLTLVPFGLLNNPPQLLLSALPAPSQPAGSTIGAGVPWLPLWHCYCIFSSFFGGGGREEERKAEPARGCFASLIGDLTVAGLQLFERRGIFSDVTSGCCVSECLKKKPHCCPKFNARISTEEKGEKGGAGIYNTWPDVGDISGPGGNVRLWRDVFLGMIRLHHATTAARNECMHPRKKLLVSVNVNVWK